MGAGHTAAMNTGRIHVDLKRFFSTDPVQRFDAAQKATAADKQQLLSDWQSLPQVNGSRNAWLLSVGPSPGLGKRLKKPDRKSTTVHLPGLGAPCSFFKEWDSPFRKSLFKIVHLAFQPTGLSDFAAESLFLHMNLDISPEGLEARIIDGKLRSGLTRLRIVLEKVKPRLVVALTKRTYETIKEGASSGAISQGISVSDEQPHEEEADGKRYRWKSCSLTLPATHTALLTGILQHPSRGATVSGYEERVGAYLASRVRQILHSADNQPV
jgi:hypothetical protein